MLLLSVNVLAVDFDDDDQDDFDDLISEAKSYIEKKKYAKAKNSLKEAKSLGINEDEINHMERQIVANRKNDFDHLLSEARSYIKTVKTLSTITTKEMEEYYDKAKKNLKKAKSLGINANEVKKVQNIMETQIAADNKLKNAMKSMMQASGGGSRSGSSSSSGSCSKHVRLVFDTPGPDVYLKVKLTTPSDIYVDSNSGGVLYVSSYSKCIGGRYSFSLSKGKSNWVNITNKKEGFFASASFSIRDNSKSCNINISSYSDSVSVSCF